jgi:hypothetical protein
MNTTLHPLADDYLRQLEHAARHMGRSDRNELVAEIRSHLDSGLSPDAQEGDVRNLLAELGSPEDIVAAAAPDRPPRRRGAREIVALLLLLTGLPPVVGWLVGVGLLLWSPLWSARQKALAVLVWPGGYVVAVGALSLSASRRSCPVTPGGLSGGASACTAAGPSLWSIAAIVVALAAPLLVATYLYLAAGRQSEVT